MTIIIAHVIETLTIHLNNTYCLYKIVQKLFSDLTSRKTLSNLYSFVKGVALSVVGYKKCNLTEKCSSWKGERTKAKGPVMLTVLFNRTVERLTQLTAHLRKVHLMVMWT